MVSGLGFGGLGFRGLGVEGFRVQGLQASRVCNRLLRNLEGCRPLLHVHDKSS